MKDIKKLLDKVKDVRVLFFLIDAKDQEDENVGGVAYIGKVNEVAQWLAMNMQMTPEVRTIVLNATNIYLNRWKANKKIEDELNITNVKVIIEDRQ